MPPIVQPPHLKHLGTIAADTRNSHQQLVSRQGLEEGTPGPAGPAGPAGPPGATFVFTEGAPSATWTIVHKLKLFPSVTVQDTAGDEVMGIVTYNSVEELTIVFSSPVAGVCYLN